ncbi:histidine phosphatase family protein [Niallia circulans]|uniref:histidine phosphatase family protein n=2 Tax=Niallia circulans TaxID=1397 RepID=UPI0015616665|nr:histidine phosphatase family protein [Niallia circulans]NRG32408.1 histidine phosphatase family protein [Niallia circulans]
MGDTMVIALLRHGLTAANERKAYIGWTDAPLSGKGRNMLYEKGRPVSKYDWISTSDLLRTKETAAYWFPEQILHSVSAFREINFGDWEGKTYEQLKELPEYCKWLNAPFTNAPTNGESFAELIERVDRGWNHLIKQSTRNNRMAVVTHGGVIRYLLSKYGVTERDFWDYTISPGEGIELIWSHKESFRRKERCTLLQEVAFTGKKVGQ